jgi:hypothetical protein
MIWQCRAYAPSIFGAARRGAIPTAIPDAARERPWECDSIRASGAK